MTTAPLVPDPSAASGPLTPRQALRKQLAARRSAFAGDACAAAAAKALATHLAQALAALEPTCLGLYWPIRSEFDPMGLIPHLPATRLALPYCRREPREMHYRAWDTQTPRTVDECRIPASDGPAVAPDVVLAPCVGYTRSGLRLGYGGGYFDRWLEAHPHATVVGVAWSVLEIREVDLDPQPHDLPMTLIVTELGVVDA